MVRSEEVNKTSTSTSKLNKKRTVEMPCQRRMGRVKSDLRGLKERARI